MFIVYVRITEGQTISASQFKMNHWKVGCYRNPWVKQLGGLGTDFCMKDYYTSEVTNNYCKSSENLSDPWWGRQPSAIISISDQKGITTVWATFVSCSSSRKLYCGDNYWKNYKYKKPDKETTTFLDNTCSKIVKDL